MSIAEYITFMRDALYQSGRNEVTRTINGEAIADGLQEILVKMNSVVTKREILEAIQNYKQIITMNPNDADSHLKLGICYLLLKDRHSALEEYKILKNLNPRMGNELLQKWNIRTPWSYRQ